jgi:hypothetical protein
VNQQTMHVRIDLGHAAVMALEMQTVRRDRSVQTMVRRERHAAADDVRCTADDALDVGFEARRLAVRAHVRAGRFHPRRYREGLRTHRARSQEAEPCASDERRASGKKQSPMEQTVASDDLQ